jgi:hypothetical protein
MLTVGENCQRRFVEPPFRHSATGWTRWSSWAACMVSTERFLPRFEPPEDNNPTSCFFVYVVGVHELESTQEPNSLSSSRIFFEPKPPFPCPGLLFYNLRRILVTGCTQRTNKVLPLQLTCPSYIDLFFNAYRCMYMCTRFSCGSCMHVFLWRSSPWSCLVLSWCIHVYKPSTCKHAGGYLVPPALPAVRALSSERRQLFVPPGVLS